jgi:hypothetical protein
VRYFNLPEEIVTFYVDSGENWVEIKKRERRLKLLWCHVENDIIRVDCYKHL